MLGDFVESWQRDFNDKLPAIVQEKHAEELFRFGHTLRGSGRQFGLLAMSDLGMEVQECARSERWDLLPALQQRLSDELVYVKQFVIENGIAPADRFRDIPSNL